MPLANAESFGTNADGSANIEYCRFCYQNGVFTDDSITMEGKIDKNIQIAMQMGMTEDDARQMATTVIPTLKRWKQ
jgi:adenine deaminase